MVLSSIPKVENVINMFSVMAKVMRMKAKSKMVARRIKIISKYVKGKDGEGVEALKPFSVNNITLKAVGPHSNGYSSKRDFKWYVEDKKWRPGLKFMANQSLVPPKNKNCIVKVVRGPFGVS